MWRFGFERRVAMKTVKLNISSVDKHFASCRGGSRNSRRWSMMREPRQGNFTADKTPGRNFEQKNPMQKKNKLRKNDGNGAQVGPKVVEVKFALECAEAKDVYVCGDFNDWSPAAVRMIKRDESGHWEKRLVLPRGRHEYKFVVDGRWIADPDSHEDVVNTFGSINSVVNV